VPGRVKETKNGNDKYKKTPNDLFVAERMNGNDPPDEYRITLPWPLLYMDITKMSTL
jgi:hypothetical protein